MRTRSPGTRRRLIESAAFGLGYVSVLVWVGSALVGSFGTDAAAPYWPAVPRLRTDTAGALAFAVAAVCLVVSRYLQLSRRRGAVADGPPAGPPRLLAAQAVADTAIVLCTGVVIYLSVNAVTHPWTLKIQLTHLLPWPSEGTVRVIALGICLVAAAVRRYLRSAGGGQAGEPATTRSDENEGRRLASGDGPTAGYWRAADQGSTAW